MAALALTALLAVLWLAFIALGYWHGGWRQVVVLAAMLLSYAVLSEWATPNGRDLATQFHWSVARATAAVGLLYLLGGTLVLGLIGSFALERPYPLTARERQCGAAMGVLDGGLLLALVLRTLRSYAYIAGGGKALHTAALSRFLIESIGYLLLAALVLGVVAVAVGLSLARRREPASLAASEPMPVPATTPPQAQRTEAQPVHAASPAPPEAQPRPAFPVPIYTTEPIIDWPTTPPPGIHVEPVATVQLAGASSLPEKNGETAEPQQAHPLPIGPSLPQRVEPPMRYPIAELVASASTSAGPIPTPASIPPEASTPPPAVALPPLPPASSVPAPDSAAPVVRELDVATQDVPPVVREIDVATHNILVAAPASDLPSAADPPAAQTSANEGEKMDAPHVATPDSIAPVALTETAPIPTVVPPSLPSMPARRSHSSTGTPEQRPTSPTPSERPSSEDEAAKRRAGFARVAIARQPGQRFEQPPAPQPVPQPPAEPQPLHPPLPTGPRVHACPTCGYPVRDHARYCPNCGARQGR